jgi:branched-chain amino acid aminotransferase
MYYNENTEVFLNGKWLKASDATTSLYGQTLHYGNGVFEGIRSYNTEDGTQVFKAKEHYERLLYSAEKMHINLNYSVEELTELTYELLERNNLSNAYIRPLVYLGSNMSLQPVEEVNVFLCAWEWGKYLGDQLLDVMVSSYQRPHPKSCHVEAKTVGHYTNSILATTEAKSKGYGEALLLDTNGFVAEGSGANFFYEKDGTLYTPPLGNILPGITRSTILELADELDFKVVERYFTPEDLKGADGAFFTGTAAEVAGIRSVDQHNFQLEWEDTMGYLLSKMYQQRVSHNEYKEFALV